jgi:hypothetical protein
MWHTTLCPKYIFFIETLSVVGDFNHHKNFGTHRAPIFAKKPYAFQSIKYSVILPQACIYITIAKNFAKLE